jgi:hypothetical protein
VPTVDDEIREAREPVDARPDLDHPALCSTCLEGLVLRDACSDVLPSADRWGSPHPDDEWPRGRTLIFRVTGH